MMASCSDVDIVAPADSSAAGSSDASTVGVPMADASSLVSGDSISGVSSLLGASSASIADSSSLISDGEHVQPSNNVSSLVRAVFVGAFALVLLAYVTRYALRSWKDAAARCGWTKRGAVGTKCAWAHAPTECSGGAGGGSDEPT